jgi:hypothetical protein
MKTKDLYNEIQTPAGLETRLEALIDSLAETERRTKRRVRMYLWAGTIAACIVIAISAGLLLMPEKKPDTSSVLASSRGIRQIDDPETAYREVKKALELMSENLNKGLDELDFVVTTELERSNEIISKTLIKH